MSFLRESREVKKVKALRRAEFALKQRFERIDWEEDVLWPEVEAILGGRPVLGLQAGAAFDIEVKEPHATLHHGSADGHPEGHSDRAAEDPGDDSSAAGA